MYEQFRMELYHRCKEEVGEESSAIVVSVLDSMMDKYDIVEKGKSLVACGADEMPKSVQYYLDCCRLKRMSKGTICNYEHKLRYFFETIQMPVGEIKKLNIRQFLSILEQKGVKGSTINSYYSTLNSFFTWCQNEEIISENPMKNVERAKCNTTCRQAVTELDIEKLKSACDSDFHRALLEVMFSTGVRVSELCNLKIENILDDEKMGDVTPIMVVNGKGAKDRRVYIKDSSMMYVKRYLESKKCKSEYIFSHDGKQYKRVQIGRIIREIKNKAEITKPLSPHICRHTCATNLLRRGADLEVIQQLLGHSNINTTLIYAHADRSKVMGEISKYSA